jgi:hypothetical protein
VLYIDLIAVVLSERALALAKTNENDLDFMGRPTWFWNIVMGLDCCCAVVIFIGYVYAEEFVAAGRAILVVFACLLIWPLQRKATEVIQAADSAEQLNGSSPTEVSHDDDDDDDDDQDQDDSNTVNGDSNTNDSETRPLLGQKKQHAKKPLWSFRLVGFHTVILMILYFLALQSIFRAVDHEFYPPPGDLIPVRNSTYRVHLHCYGGDKHKGGDPKDSSSISNTKSNNRQKPDLLKTPPTILFDSGLGVVPSVFWRNVAPQISDNYPDTRICIYDRAGYGWSDSGPLPQTPKRNAWALKEALDTSGEKGPYVLVGHSFGGYDMRVFQYGMFLLPGKLFLFLPFFAALLTCSRKHVHSLPRRGSWSPSYRALQRISRLQTYRLEPNRIP